MYFKNRCFIFSFLMFILVFGKLPDGYTMESESVPKRVISLGPIITEMIYLLEADSRLIANTTYCIVPPQAKQKQKIGTVLKMNVEKIISLEPDLVLANSLTSQKQIVILKNQDIRVIKFENAKTFDEMCQMTVDLGIILGKKEIALQMTGMARKEVDFIRTETKDLPKRKVFIQIGIKPLKTTTTDTFINEYIKFSGGMNIVRDAKTMVFSREKVVWDNPDVILISTMGSSKTAGENEKAIWMKIDSINAVKNNEVYVLDPDIVCSPTPATFVKGLKEISQLIHPNRKKRGKRSDLK